MMNLNDLLRAVGEELEQGRDLSGDFLARNRIDFDELKLIETAGTVLKGVAALPPERILTIVMVGQGIPLDIALAHENGRRLEISASQLVQALNKL